MRLIDVLVHKKSLTPCPIWMMRQAGRYLPEYKEVRKNYDDFMQFCFSSEDVVKVTLQPVERFPLDAAIIFSDILVIPHILGQRVWFEPDHGPKLEKIDFNAFLKTAPLISFKTMLASVADAIAKTRATLDPTKALIGFAGAPWTVLSYMISSGKTADFNTVLHFAKQNTDIFSRLLALIEEKVAELLCLHISAGANAVQIFESWAIAVPPKLRNLYLYAPLKRIIHSVRKEYPSVPIIYYARGVSSDYKNLRDLDIAFGIDETADITKLRAELPHAVLQGNLSPQKLLNGDFDTDVDHILKSMQGTPHIFNLGHGINKDTPIAHVERMIKRIQKIYS
ncbi:MAG: uroporphyrinogen decarboxylase [Candidatus Paracaedibacteraceae bacterium]|nr:uroporphyrinogen decarboxylase [Candidatus Paracaedibacteraceae bacterium]